MLVHNMKYKITVNDTIMEEGITADKALSLVCNVMQTRSVREDIRVSVYYLTKDGKWSFKNGFTVYSIPK